MIEIYEEELNHALPELATDEVIDIDYIKSDISDIFENINKNEDMDAALWYLQLEKSHLSKNNHRSSDRYAILSLVEKM